MLAAEAIKTDGDSVIIIIVVVITTIIIIIIILFSARQHKACRLKIVN